MASWSALMQLTYCVLRSRQLGLKLPIHAHFFFGGGIFSQMASLFILTPKRHLLLRGNTSFEPLSVCASAAERIEKKIRTVKKVTKVLYFTCLGRIPRLAHLPLNLHVGWCSGRNHQCQISEWNFERLRFYRWSNFPFSYWFYEWPLQQCSATALPVISRCHFVNVATVLIKLLVDRSIDRLIDWLTNMVVINRW